MKDCLVKELLSVARAGNIIGATATEMVESGLKLPLCIWEGQSQEEGLPASLL